MTSPKDFLEPNLLAVVQPSQNEDGFMSDFFCTLHKVECHDWCEQCESDTSDVLTQRKLANSIRSAFGWGEIPAPSRCGCRGIVHTCNTIT